MVQGTVEEETYSFIPLLKPIKAITKDWDYELIEFLEDYINYIRMYHVSDMNFSEAAILIQNSALIYNKKVDALADIFKNFLEHLGKRKGVKNGTGINERQGEQVEGQVEGDENVNTQGEKKKKKNIYDYGDGLLDLENIVSERDIDEKPKSSNKKVKDFEKIILNTAAKVQFPRGYSIDIYIVDGDETVKKEDFRLYSRMSHCGTLNEEFSSENAFMFKKQTCRDDTIVEDTDSDGEPPPDTSLPNVIHEENVFDAENQQSEELLEKFPRDHMNRPEENIVNIDEVEALLLQPRKENEELPEKAIQIKKMNKVPVELLEEKKKENKRKWTEFTDILGNYDVTEFLILDHSKKRGFGFDKELAEFEEKEERSKKQLMKRKTLFNELVLKEAGQDLCEDFHGFHDMEPDGLDGFAGFDDDDDDDRNQDNGNNAVLNVPLPDNELFHQNDEDPGMDTENTYENEAQKVIETHGLMKSMNYVQDTDMKKRVDAWHKTIQPKLKAAEERAHFDIHEYGTKILDKFPNSKGKFTMPFAKVVSQEPPEEVARYFLSSLMLANTYNLEITSSDPSELAVDCMDLTLLSRARHYEAIDDNMKATSKEH